MKESVSQKLLDDLLEDLNKALFQLEHSFSLCKIIQKKESFNQDELDKIEVFTSRFTRLSDILIKRAYRTIDAYLMEEGGTLIDVLNRAEKRGLIHSLEEIRTLKDMRNLIAHEYAKNEIDEIFKNILSYTPILISLVIKLENYCENNLFLKFQ